MNKVYESPKMRFVALRAENNVANQCWAFANNNDEAEDNLYYNSPGKGWVVFSVTGGNCSNTKVLSYRIDAYADGMNKEEQEAAANALKNYWQTTASNGGSPFKGSSSDYSEGEPGKEWS